MDDLDRKQQERRRRNVEDVPSQAHNRPTEIGISKDASGSTGNTQKTLLMTSATVYHYLAEVGGIL